MWSNRREMKYFKFHTISKSETTLIDKIMDTYKKWAFRLIPMKLTAVVVISATQQLQ